MKQLYIILLIINLSISSEQYKILHMSLHSGCINDFQAVCDTFQDIALTSWYIHDDHTHFDEYAQGSAVYNIGHDRAARIWQKHKEYFNQFDLIITSDTAPLSRIFLQNDWQKPLIIWVCNRFDYYDGASLDCHFPDPEYYALFKKAAHLPNVKIISYTPYEHFYGVQKGVNWGSFVIKPIGTPEIENKTIESRIPQHINKSETFFVNPRLESWGLHPGYQYNYLKNECLKRGIPVFTGPYNGPEDIKDFKGVIFFPYAWSNLALFENIQRGVVHYVPSIRFIKELVAQNKPVTYFALDHLELCEWYQAEYKDLFVYFDSWDDLKNKIHSTNYEQKKAYIKSFGKKHRVHMLQKWQDLLSQLRIK